MDAYWRRRPGDAYYDLYRSRDAARTYVVTERYRDEAAFAMLR